jgi:ABC-2 type transport system permease protein
VTSGPAEVFDLGYRGYEGERTGRGARRRAIWRDGVRISLGLGRGAGAKVAPWLLIGFALVPALVVIVISSFAASAGADPDDVDLPSYAEYYEFAHVPLILFAAIVAPLLLCPDRRDGVLSLYAARPITALDYVGARWAAFLTVAAAAAWFPQLLLFGWNALDAEDTGSWLVDEWDVVPRVLLAGAVIAVLFTTLSLLAASFATRRVQATIAILAVVFVGSTIAGIAEGSFSGTLADLLTLVGLPQVVVDVAGWILGEPIDDRPYSGTVYALWLAALTAALGLVLLRRTRRLMQA